MNWLWHSDRNTHYESYTTLESKAMPGVRYTLRRMSLERRAELTRQIGELLKRIEAAERFQLLWSSAASRSPHIEEEWRFALALGRAHFIRAFYWRHPAPGLPDALGEAEVTLKHMALALE